MVSGLGILTSWQHVTSQHALTRSRCAHENTLLRDGRRHATAAEALLPARRRQHSVLWSGAARVTMQAAPSTDMQSEHAEPSAVAPREAADAGAASADDDTAAALVPGAVADVEELCGVRVNLDDLGQPLVEYLVHWKEGGHHTWEASVNVAENLLRDFEDKWWKASREGDEETLRKMLGGGQRVLAQSVDENRRSALHFAAATGNVRVTRILCEAGAEIDLRDKDGYTPLHMASGYLHTPVVELLLAYGADPEVRDLENRSVLDLVEGLKDKIPNDAAVAQRKFALERCTEILTDTMYDVLEPRQLLDVRTNEDGTKDYLVQWPDESPDSWVNQAFIAEDVRENFETGLEYAEAAAILRMVHRGDQRQYLVRWTDSEHYPDSWEDEENVSPALVAAWEQTQGPGALQQNGAGPRRRQQNKRRRQRPAKATQAAHSDSASPAGARQV